LRGGRRLRGAARLGRRVTSSAHSRIELIRARRAGATLAFLGPALATESHRGTRGLGAIRWASLGRGLGYPILAIGGIDGATARRMPRARCAGVGAIGALQ
jgi:thiamine-phosphate pyrophosphorylase